MLHTVYSNLYEVLETCLIENLRLEQREKRNLFEDIEVLTPSRAVGESIKKKIADVFGICAGIDISQLTYWESMNGALNVNNETILSLPWHIFSILQKESFTKKYPRLSNYIKNKDERTLFIFADKVAKTFTNYAVYRLDWVLEWMGPSLATDKLSFSRRKERQALKLHKDYEWQKELWRLLDKDTKWIGCEYIKGHEKKVEEKIAKTNIHFLMPFNLSPLTLPLLKKVAKTREVYLYILNPSSQYWYESLPKRLFDSWSNQDSPEDEAQRFLIKNAKTTRANIDRIAAFVDGSNECEELSVDVNEVQFSSEFDYSREKFSNFEKEDKFDLERFRLQDIKLNGEYAYLAYFINYEQPKTLLNSFQSAITNLDAARLFTEVENNDKSIIIQKAVTPKRELESILNIIHSLINREKEPLKPNDILVVTPNLSEMTPIIESVLNSQEKGREIPWFIAQKHQIDESQVIATFVATVNWIKGKGTAQDFYELLEMPAMLEVLGLDLDKLEVAKELLSSAGFRAFLSKEHAKQWAKDTNSKLSDSDFDGSLEMALTRLCLGLTMPDDTIFSSTLAISKPISGFNNDVVSNKDVLVSLLAIFDSFVEVKTKLLDANKKENAQYWQSWISECITQIFGKLEGENGPQEDFFKLRKDTDLLCRAIIASGVDNSKISFEVFWLALSNLLTSKYPRVNVKGGVCFSDMNQFRGLNYKCIAIFGLSADSNYPGIEARNEFDLMNLKDEKGCSVSRRGDRTSREDNRNAFLEHCLAAREKLIISYATGLDPKSKVEPSPLITEFESFLSFAARSKDISLGKALIDAIHYEVPGTATDIDNFKKINGKTWDSFDERYFSAAKQIVEVANEKLNERDEKKLDEEFFFNASLVGLVDREISLESVKNFVLNSTNWILSQIGTRDYLVDEDIDVAIGLNNGALEQKLRYNKFMANCFAGISKTEIKALAHNNPKFGALGVREWIVDPEIDAACDAFEFFNKKFQSKTRLERTLWKVPCEWGLKNITGVVLPARDVYNSQDLAILVKSAGDKKKAILEYLIRLEANQVLNLWIIEDEIPQEPYDFNLANNLEPKDYLEVLFKTLDATIEYGPIVLKEKVPGESVPVSESILLRGIDTKSLSSSTKHLVECLESILPKQKRVVKQTEKDLKALALKELQEAITKAQTRRIEK